MPWNNRNGGGRSGGRGPWGGGSPGQPQPPDLEELLKRSQDRLKQVFPRGGFGKGGLSLIALLLIAVWIASGIYVIEPDEQGVVLRFGKFVERTNPGINYHLPWPVETVLTPKVTRENQVNVGYRLDSDLGRASDRARDVAEESLMLTGDENIVDIDFTVFWLIKDAGAFLFNVEDPEAAIKAVAESVMREVAGRNEIELILTENRDPIQSEVRDLMQQTLDSYGVGATITRVQMQKVDPPAQVIDAYRDVQAARADQERLRNEAEAYANKIIPEARGEAARIGQQAEAYKQRVIAEAEGEAKRFISIYDEYRKAPGVTRKRIFLETMERVLGDKTKVIVDSKAGTGVVPYLPLPEIDKRSSNQGVEP